MVAAVCLTRIFASLSSKINILCRTASLTLTSHLLPNCSSRFRRCCCDGPLRPRTSAPPTPNATLLSLGSKLAGLPITTGPFLVPPPLRRSTTNTLSLFLLLPRDPHIHPRIHYSTTLRLGCTPAGTNPPPFVSKLPRRPPRLRQLPPSSTTTKPPRPPRLPRCRPRSMSPRSP